MKQGSTLNPKAPSYKDVHFDRKLTSFFIAIFTENRRFHIKIRLFFITIQQCITMSCFLKNSPFACRFNTILNGSCALVYFLSKQLTSCHSSILQQEVSFFYCPFLGEQSTAVICKGIFFCHDHCNSRCMVQIAT